MILFSKTKKGCEEERETPEILRAREYLNSIHPANHLFYGREPYHYLETSQKGKYQRYHFYKGMDRRLIYIVLSDTERSEVEKTFKEKIEEGECYVYQDTILSEIFCDVVQHRFYMPNGCGETRAYMTDDGTVGYGNLVKDD